MDLTSFLPLLIQVPLVGAFMWFVLQLNKSNDISSEKREIQWQKFLEEQAQRHVDAMKDITREVNELAKVVSSTNALIVQHDTWERIEIERRLRT